MDIKKYDTQKLLELYTKIMKELMDREIIRTSNNPVADYAEYLVAKKMQLELAIDSTSGYDAQDKKGVRYQIKSRRISDHNKSRQLGVIRNLDQDKFDYLIGVLMDSNFKILEVYQIPIQAISSYSRFSKHQNGHILRLKGEILKDKEVKDITSLFL